MTLPHLPSTAKQTGANFACPINIYQVMPAINVSLPLLCGAGECEVRLSGAGQGGAGAGVEPHCSAAECAATWPYPPPTAAPFLIAAMRANKRTAQQARPLLHTQLSTRHPPPAPPHARPCRTCAARSP